ncbi:aminomethyl transferase family protein, partial [Pseudomonas sp. CrR25]|nr:aminomethyl transferase family protein [Pseudomonas sp. CrR25]
GLVEGGTKAYFSTVFESGWMAYPLPAIYTDEELRPFREWLSATSWEASSQLGGSFYSENIEDYYTTPWDLGYERILKFDHDFIGREALEKMAGEKRRAKVTLVWNKEDVAKVFNSLLHEDTPFKYIDLPVSSYAFQQCDEVQNSQGKHIGLSNLCGYSGNEKEMLSLAMIEVEYATPGTEVVLIWGEIGGGSRKSHVERHAQTTIRATVAPSPYAEAVRQMKRAGI